MERLIAAALLSAAFLQFACAFSVTKISPHLGSDLIQLRQDSANDILCSLLKDDDAAKTQTPVLLEGLVSKRRAIGKHLVFLDILPLEIPKIEDHNERKMSTDLDAITPVQAIFRRDFWDSSDSNNNLTISSYDVYHKVIQPGVHVKVMGHSGPSRNTNEAILFCHSAKYTLANNNPQHLRNVLRYVREGALDLDEVVDALPCVDRKDLANMIDSGKQQTSPSFGEMAVELLDRFPRNFLCNPSQLMGSTNLQKVKLLPPAPPEYIKAPDFLKSVDDAEGEVVSIAHVLREQRQISSESPQNSNAYRQFTITGWVQNRRRYQGSISVLELVDEFSALASPAFDTNGDLAGEEEGNGDNDTFEQNSKLRELWRERIYAVLHPESLNVGSGSAGTMSIAASSIELSETYGNILSSGASVLLQGYLSSGSAGDAQVFWATSCRLMRSSWRPSAVKQVLDILHEGKFAVDEAADALKLSDSEAEDIANGNTSATERQWFSAELTRSLQSEASRVGKITKEMEDSLASFAYARDQYPVEKIQLSTRLDSAQAVTSSLQSGGSPLRTSPEGSRWQRAKKPQLKFMIELIGHVLRSHPEFGKRKLKVVDIGGGRGLLSNFLAETFGSDIVEVQVVDISRSATNNGMMRARRRGLQNIQFAAMDATTFNVTGIDVVVALHACGALSDVSLGHAVCQGAGFVICPCCFNSNPHLRVSIPRDENGRVDLVTAEEWLNVDPAQYGQLKQLAELQGDINTASRAMATICGLRAMAVDRLWHNSRWPQAKVKTSIKTFPIGFSTRNLCLVGHYHNV